MSQPPASAAGQQQMVKRVGNYELGKTIGRGTFSKVKYGVDLKTGKAYAIKIVDRAQVVKEHMEAQLKREIAIMKMLSHRNIVNMMEVLQTQRNIYIVLELVTGGELFDRIVSAKRFDEDTARSFFQQLIVGIDYCHKHGIAHRDLKPENLLLDENDVLKISDFGLSALPDNQAQQRGGMLTTTCGTPNYVAPEVLAEKGYDGMRADIWSCGVILFVMLAGYLPFDDPNLNALFQKIEKGEFKIPKWFTESSIDLIRRMMTVDPKKRMTVSEIRKHPWFLKNFKEEGASGQATLPAGGAQAAAPGAAASPAIAASASASAGTPAVSHAADFQNVEETRAESQVQKSAFNAFDLASHLMAGSLTGLVGKSDSTKIKRATQFMANGHAADVSAAMLSALSQMHCEPVVKNNGLVIKCVKSGARGQIMFTVEINPTVTGMCLVECLRSRGDILEFHEVYRALYDRIRNIVSSTDATGHLSDAMARTGISH